MVGLLAGALVLPALARADVARQIAQGTALRARRAFALGPLVGGAGTYLFDPGEFEGQLSFGLGLYWFDVPLVPDIQKLVEARAQALLKERVKQAMAGGGAPTQEDLAEWGREVYEEARDELLGKRGAKLVEKPRFALTFEGARVFRSEGWQVRASAGLGIKSFTAGLTTAVQFGTGDTIALVGPEVAIKFLPGKGPRSPVIDVFVRYEFAFLEDANAPSLNQLSLGARLLVDVI